MSKVKVNDISMYYEIHGQGEPIVFIGGFSVDHTMWAEIIAKFQDKYQVILFDNRGSGQTDIPDGPYSIEEMANDVVTLCSKLGVKKAHYVGNSMGGFIVQALAYLYPDIVKSVVISNSAATIHTCFNIYLAAQLELLKSKAPLAALIKASSSWVFSYQFLSQPGMLDSLVQIGLENPYPFTVKGYEGQYAAVKQFNSESWIKTLRVPSLVLASDEDLIFSEPTVKFIAEQIPNAKYHCFSRCGHLPMIEYPEEFSLIVQQFIHSLQL